MKVSYLKKFLAITLIFVMQFQSVHASVAIGGGWWLDKPVVNGVTTTWEAFKNGARSTVAISPSSAQVAKSLLRGGLVGLALSAVTQALLDGIDFVLDPTNNSIRYKQKPAETCNSNLSNCRSFKYVYRSAQYPSTNYYSSPEAVCYAYATAHSETLSFLSFDKKNMDCTYQRKDADFLNGSTVVIEENPYYREFEVSSLITVATQIINLAEQGNPDTKAYIASVVQDMLEHDEDYRKSLEAQLDAKLQQAQSIGSNNGNNNNGGNNNSGNNSAPKPVPSTSGNSTTANPTPPTPPNNDDEDANQKINNVLKDAKFLKKSSTKQFEKVGGFTKAKEDFDSLGLQNVRGFSIKNRPAWHGQFKNGINVIVRDYSSEGSPTLEIQLNTKIEIRYK